MPRADWHHCRGLFSVPRADWHPCRLLMADCGHVFVAVVVHLLCSSKSTFAIGCTILWKGQRWENVPELEFRNDFYNTSFFNDCVLKWHWSKFLLRFSVLLTLTPLEVFFLVVIGKQTHGYLSYHHDLALALDDTELRPVFGGEMVAYWWNRDRKERWLPSDKKHRP